MIVQLSEDFKFLCAECESELSAEVVDLKYGTRGLKVWPCEKCLREAEADGETNGRREAEAEMEAQS